jgi:ABC-type phosphate transport system permease subunit
MCPDNYTSFTVGCYGNKKSHRVTCGCTGIDVVRKVKGHIVVSWVMTLCSLIGVYRIVEETASFMFSVGELKPSLM